MTTTKPDKILTFADIPARVPGGAKYMPGPRKPTDKTVDVIMQATDGRCSVIDTAPNEQAAFRKAIRWQRRENAAVTKAARK